ncbi:MAG: hypothetical protein R3D66_01005 [Alphaproteobacteria bacterium]
MKYSKKLLLASAAVMALGLGAPSSAQAFDEVNWTWNVDANKEIDEHVDINVEISPSGMVTVEGLQENIGNVSSTSTVSNINNNTPGIGEDGVVFIDETMTVDTTFPLTQGAGDTQDSTNDNVFDDPNGLLTGTVEQASLTENANSFSHSVDINVQGEVELEAIEGVNNAVDLPKVENTATSVANNYSLESSVASNVNVGQLNYGGFNVSEPGSTQFGDDPILDQQQYLGQTYDSVDNAHVAKAYTAGLAAALGIITQGEVTANASVYDINNATVENTATAVGNNISIDIAAATPADAFLVADLTQFNYANTTATANVSNVSLDNYTGFGEAGFGNCGGCVIDGLHDGPQVPIISNTATAVGNNTSIKVSSPDLGL